MSFYQISKNLLFGVSLLSLMSCNSVEEPTLSLDPVTTGGETTNSGQSHATSEHSPYTSPSSSPASNLPAYTQGVLDLSCMSNSSYDTCIFLKNPVAQNGAEFTPSVTPTSNLDSVLIYGVKLPPLDTSGYLKNSYFTIYVSNFSNTSRLRMNDSGNWKYPFSNGCSGTTCTVDPNHSVGQLMAFYWLNYQKDYFLAQTGIYHAVNYQVPVLTYLSPLQNAYWDGYKIVMGDGYSTNDTSAMGEFALSAEVYIHEMGHANLSFATTAITSAFSPCSGDNTESCCSTEKGCIGAIHEGQADYQAGIIFPQNGGVVGETLMNRVTGLNECGLSRTIGNNKYTTAIQAFKACRKGYYGEVHLLGRVYASIWWEVRNKTGNNPKEIDILFQEHLKTLQESDTFVTALDKIIATDAALYHSKYGQDFISEFARRGL